MISGENKYRISEPQARMLSLAVRINKWDEVPMEQRLRRSGDAREGGHGEER